MKATKAVIALFLFALLITACQKDIEEYIENKPPIVNAGSDTAIDLTNAVSDSIRLNGSAIDADGTIVGFSWNQVSGPSKSHIINPGSSSTYVNGLVSGKYVFQLMATDDKGAVGVKTVGITIIQKTLYPHNMIPIVNPGRDTAVTITSATADSIRLSGSAVDIDGLIVGYLWSQISGPNSAHIKTPGATSTSISGLITGRYVFQLMAVDDKGATGIKSVAVTVVVPQAISISLQPALNPAEGYIHSMTPGESANLSTTELPVSAWTNGGSTQIIRGLLKFDLSGIPASASITSAKISLYSTVSPNSGNQVDANFGANNTLLIQRIATSWSSAVSWQTQPAVDMSAQVVIPHSSQSRLDLVDIDVTNMVREMKQSGNYGFLLKLQNETIYTSRMFYSSKHSNTAKHPKLVLQYTN